jgi:hypothetical protein
LQDLKSLEFRITLAYFQLNGSLEEAHRMKISKAIVAAILEEDPDKM